MPLNYIRASAVFLEASQLYYFDHARVIEDWGCGAGSASWAALNNMTSGKEVKLIGYDQSKDALGEFDFWAERMLALHGSWPGRFKISSALKNIDELETTKADTYIISYALNEVDEWPAIPSHAERLVVIEPSTHQAGRKVLKLRQELLEKGWYAWAPCTHQYDCPLLVGSGRDWCHNRIHWNKPQWYEAIESHLPMKNDTLTYTYVLFSKEPAPEKLNHLTRVVGDLQEEQGKSRQLICRGPSREFLSWLHRDGHNILFHRGDLLRVQDDMPKANEARVTESTQINVIRLDDEKA